MTDEKLALDVKTRYEEIVPNITEILVNIEKTETKNEADVFENWKIKNEELDLKEEDLESCHTSSSICLDQNRVESVSTSQCDNKVFTFKCVHCNYKTVYQIHLEIHLLHHRTTEDHKFTCDTCKFQTFHKKSFKRHLLLHAAKVFKCDKCPYQASRRWALRSHGLWHKKPKEVVYFQCHQCNYRTVQKGNLKKHLVRHQNRQNILS